MNNMLNNCDKCGSANTNNARYCSACGYELPKINSVDKEVQNKTPDPKKTGRKRIIRKIAVYAASFAAAAIAYYATYTLFRAPNIDKALMSMASEINQHCPVMIDSDTRLDNTIASFGKTLQYNYTLINFENTDIDTISLKEYLEPVLANNFRTSPDMEYLRKEKVTLKYIYKDKNGNYSFSIALKPEKYK